MIGVCNRAQRCWSQADARRLLLPACSNSWAPARVYTVCLSRLVFTSSKNVITRPNAHVRTHTESIPRPRAPRRAGRRRGALAPRRARGSRGAPLGRRAGTLLSLAARPRGRQ